MKHCEKCGKQTNILIPLYTTNRNQIDNPYDTSDCIHGEYFDPNKFIEKYSKKDLKKYNQIIKHNNAVKVTDLCRECYEK
jgi:hypothetical protein